MAQSIKISPDSIDMCGNDNDVTMYLIHDFKGMNFAIGFKEVPGIKEAREAVKDNYLAGCELEFDFEFSDISKSSK